MPLSHLTYLRAAIIVIVFALSLFCPEVAALVLLLLLPLLIWLLVSNAVKEAPPFDESAFHRTRPVTAGRVFLRLAGFHLLVLAGFLVVLLLYAWHYNLGWREMVIGAVLLGVPWVALVSLFATVSSLSTSNQHWKGWGFVALLLLPAISMVGFYWAILAKWYKEPSEAAFVAIPVVAAVLCPALWWLVAAKGRWTLGCFLGLASGVAFPWIISGIKLPDFMPDITDLLVRQPQVAELPIRRLKDPAVAAGMLESQARVSRLLEIQGLRPDEFIGGIGMIKLRNRDEAAIGSMAFDLDLRDMEGTAFSTDANGRLVPATAALFHVMGLENAEESRFPVWAKQSSELGLPKLAKFLSLPLRSPRDYNLNHPSAKFDSAESTWSMSGAVYRWEKLLDTTAKEGGRAKLRGGGVVVMRPVDPSFPIFEITVRSIQGIYQSDPDIQGLHPVLVAQGENGLRRFVESNSEPTDRGLNRGFLEDRKSFQFRAPLGNSQTYGRIRAVEDIRLELYWPVFRGLVNASLPPPK